MAERKRPSSPDESGGGDDHIAMGARIREAREFLGLSQEAIAEHLGIPRASVSAIESGRRKVSSMELRELSLLYRRPLEWFYSTDTVSASNEDETVQALFRATRNLNEEDKQQVLRFAEFLKGAGPAPKRRSNK